MHRRRPSARPGALRHRLRQRARLEVWRRADRRPAALLVGRLPSWWRPPAPGDRKVEIGSGFRPTPGRIHVDVVPGLPDLDVVAPADRVPLPAGWIDELLAVHMIEHVPAATLPRVLRHWHELMRPGARLLLHTPNAAVLGRLLADPATPLAVLWPVQAALFGYDRAPDAAGSAEALGVLPDHRLTLTFPLLRSELEAAGFGEVTDVSGTDSECRHAHDWRDVVPGMCLEVTAVRSG